MSLKNHRDTENRSSHLLMSHRDTENQPGVPSQGDSPDSPDKIRGLEIDQQSEFDAGRLQV